MKVQYFLPKLNHQFHRRTFRINVLVQNSLWWHIFSINDAANVYETFSAMDVKCNDTFWYGKWKNFTFLTMYLACCLVKNEFRVDQVYFQQFGKGHILLNAVMEAINWICLYLWLWVKTLTVFKGQVYFGVNDPRSRNKSFLGPRNLGYPQNSVY